MENSLMEIVCLLDILRYWYGIFSWNKSNSTEEENFVENNFDYSDEKGATISETDLDGGQLYWRTFELIKWFKTQTVLRKIVKTRDEKRYENNSNMQKSWWTTVQGS